MSKFDLHMHSHYSFDGEKSPKELIKMAKEKNLICVALSDHNDMHGIDEMILCGKKEGIKVIPAVEFNTLFEGLEIDLLGYNFDYHKEYYINLVDHLQKIMHASAKKRLDLFKECFHISFTLEEIIEIAGPNGNLYNNMMHKILLDPLNKENPLLQDYLPNGKRSDMPEINFYWDYCSSGKRFYVPVEYPSFKETVERIHQDGGIAILAHPWNNFYQKEELLLKAIEYGVDGIEAYSNYHSPAQNEYYEDFTKRHHILITCGSDYHGKMKPQIQMGEYGYTKENEIEILQNFLNRIQK